MYKRLIVINSMDYHKNTGVLVHTHCVKNFRYSKAFSSYKNKQNTECVSAKEKVIFSNKNKSTRSSRFSRQRLYMKNTVDCRGFQKGEFFQSFETESAKMARIELYAQFMK